MNIFRSERGFSLIELLASLVIVAVVLISFAAFFVQSGKFNAHNQSKLVAVNLARGTLEQLPLDGMEPPLEGQIYDYGWCKDQLQDEKNCETFFKPVVNDKAYDIVIKTGQAVEDVKRDGETDVKLLIPAVVYVYGNAADGSWKDQEPITYVEGYVAHEP
ncbi:hypothetical protein CathTA2_2949 [Caldalkalibacillus thermarum TA2.A1]|uniref:Type II secretion system GspH family protein n=1 Tax=Caldalkalibacillus thermarum (strain TA2.A1) TaxID=986075 RepID=F5LAL4_CALTT|nr:type II secretion system protein [Caldalkalibacillus thermarum]EGL81586.1 hypothetical protein CathTA2_2949 [Caldalkalibacillus thermarum TA2.A1]QZT33524.1 type II secretion system GspH family protein [Caldalkalibacillus thermarum TA2.A1]